jgi:hypothetical protein
MAGMKKDKGHGCETVNKCVLVQIFVVKRLLSQSE